MIPGWPALADIRAEGPVLITEVVVQRRALMFQLPWPDPTRSSLLLGKGRGSSLIDVWRDPSRGRHVLGRFRGKHHRIRTYAPWRSTHLTDGQVVARSCSVWSRLCGVEHHDLSILNRRLPGAVSLSGRYRVRVCAGMLRMRELLRGDQKGMRRGSCGL